MVQDNCVVERCIAVARISGIITIKDRNKQSQSFMINSIDLVKIFNTFFECKIFVNIHDYVVVYTMQII